MTKNRRQVLQTIGVGSLSALAGCGKFSTGENRDSNGRNSPPVGTTPSATISPTETLSPTPKPTPTVVPIQSPEQESMLTPNDRSEKSIYFGASVAFNGETALIGADLASGPNSSDQGAVYVFNRNDDGWVQSDKLVVTDGGFEHAFGSHVEFSGDTAVIGAHGYTSDESVPYRGAAYIFKRSDNTWVRQARIEANDPDAQAKFARFGNSVAIDDDIVLVSARSETNDYGESAGAVYAFKEEGGKWNRQSKIVASDVNLYDYFGKSIDFDGERTLICSRQEPIGAGYIFKKEDDNWLLESKLTPDNPDVAKGFGAKAAIKEDTIAIGDTLNAENGGWSGAVHVYQRSGSSWYKEAKLTPDGGDKKDRFGGSLAFGFGGKILLVGAQNDEDPNGFQSGSAYLFRKEHGEWRQIAKLSAPDGRRGDAFGGVTIHDRIVMVSARNYERDNKHIGKVYVYNL